MQKSKKIEISLQTDIRTDEQWSAALDKQVSGVFNSIMVGEGGGGPIHPMFLFKTVWPLARSNFFTFQLHKGEKNFGNFFKIAINLKSTY